MSIRDEHYDRPGRPPVRAVRPRTSAELAFLALGPVATAFLRAAAASGATKLPAELAAIADLERAHGRQALVAASSARSPSAASGPPTSGRSWRLVPGRSG